MTRNCPSSQEAFTRARPTSSSDYNLLVSPSILAKSPLTLLSASQIHTHTLGPTQTLTSLRKTPQQHSPGTHASSEHLQKLSPVTLALILYHVSLWRNGRVVAGGPNNVHRSVLFGLHMVCIFLITF